MMLKGPIIIWLHCSSQTQSKNMCSLQVSNYGGVQQTRFFTSISCSEKLCQTVIFSSFWGRNVISGNGISPSLFNSTEKRRFSFGNRKQTRVLAMSTSTETAFKMNVNEYLVTLEKPLGIRFALSVDGKIFVHSLKKGGNAEKSRIIMVGDTLKKVSESSGGRLIEIKDFGDTENMMKEKSGSCSLVLERPFSPFPIHQLYLVNELDLSFNRGRVPIITWNKSILASNLRTSCEGSGNSGFVSFSPKFLTPRGWKYLNDKSETSQPKMLKNTPSLPFSPLVSIFSEEEPGDGDWGHGSFPLEEYVKALERSKGELYYNHSLGMRCSKITEQIYVGSCIQTEADVETLSNVAVGVTTAVFFIFLANKNPII